MTKAGNKIPGITPEQIRDQLKDETDPKAIKRLTAAREYLDGSSPAQIEDKYGWKQFTIYNWLNRFEERGFEAALYDDKPPGRPPELSDEQFKQFEQALHQSPEEVGYDDPAWTSALAQQYLLEAFDIAFSRRHVRRFMSKAGVSRQKPRPQPASADEEEREEFQHEAQKN